jgi:hypothetical protein
MQALSPWYMHKAYFYVYAKATALVYSFHKLGNEASLVGIAAILTVYYKGDNYLSTIFFKKFFFRNQILFFNLFLLQF